MKKLLFFLTHLLADCSGDKNRDGLDSQIQKETDWFIRITAGGLAFVNLQGNEYLNVVNSGYELIIPNDCAM